MIARLAWLALLVLLCAGSWWVLAKLDAGQRDQLVRERHIADVYMNDFSTQVMGPTGEVVRELTATGMAHYNDTQTSEFSKPHIVLHRDDGPPWHIASDTGWVSADGDTMRFNGKVLIWRENDVGERTVEVTTSDLVVQQDREIGETANAVRIETSNSDTRGVGMRAYLDQGRIELLSDVRTLYSNSSR